MDKRWKDWARELQAIGQTGCAYSKDVFDTERYERIRVIAAEIVSEHTGIPEAEVEELFCREEGYPTPKLDTRAAIFQDNKILLVRERNGKWSLPGGWVDLNESVKSNTVKEVKEESGLDVEAVRIIAVQDRNQHNVPAYLYGVCKIFVECRLLGGTFTENIETTESAYFALDELPELAEEKNSREQIRLCFRASGQSVWEPEFD